MGFRCNLLIFFLALLGLATAQSAPPAQDSKKAGNAETKKTETVTFTKQVTPFLATHCTKCHSGTRARAGLALDKYKDEATAQKDRNVWERVAQVLRAHEMPPPRRPQPKADEIQAVTAWIDGVLATNICTGQKDPGRVTVRRLNRAEYNNTIRDLVGVPFQPAEDFPADDVGYGFDNIGDVLTLPPLLMEKYLAAAEQIVTQAMSRPETRRRIMICQPTEKTKEECARKIIENFARRAYRRPLFPEEANRLAAFVQLAEANGDGFDKGIELALEAILTSPHFLFRVERGQRPGSRFTYQTLTDYELATRLSYFLWSSMPDDELFELAARGNFRTLPVFGASTVALGVAQPGTTPFSVAAALLSRRPGLRMNGNLEAQVRRMLHDPKSKALFENFGSQWLQTRNVKTASPDPGQFPTFDESLRAAMLKETELFFNAIKDEDRSIFDFLDANFTFVNERLARHYGIPGVKGQQFRRVQLTGGPRGGILTQASILTLTSNPTRTSPVKRGKWILENILGTPPPPPPPDAGELSEDKAVVLSGTLGQRMEQHRAKPNCATCHQRMDPLGFGFENFDAVGAWRDKDGQFPIDPSGVLPGGQTFKGPVELKAILKTKADEFRRCLTEKMLTYALGRGLESYDKCAVDDIVAALARNNNKFSTLVIEIVKSDPFQKRRGRLGP
jgi:mono/diheme cytochrome c family protein